MRDKKREFIASTKDNAPHSEEMQKEEAHVDGVNGQWRRDVLQGRKRGPNNGGSWGWGWRRICLVEIYAQIGRGLTYAILFNSKELSTTCFRKPERLLLL